MIEKMHLPISALIIVKILANEKENFLNLINSIYSGCFVDARYKDDIQKITILLETDNWKMKEKFKNHVQFQQ